MKHLLGPLGKLSLIWFSIFTLLFGIYISYASINWPTNTPNGEIFSGQLSEYFQKIKTQCPDGKILRGFDTNFNMVCANQGSMDGSVNGECGSAHLKSFTSAPNSNLCKYGYYKSIYGSGPRNWTCYGLNGGTNTNCNATKL